MTRFIKKKKQDIGLAPDELKFRGKKRGDQVSLKVLDFNSKDLTEEDTITAKDLCKLQHDNTVSWINIECLHNTSILEEITTSLSLDTLVMPEVLHTDARPRVIEYDNCILITLKMLRLDEKNHKTIIENLSLILTNTILVSLQEEPGDVFDPVRERIRKEKKRIRNGDTDYLTFALLDIIIDNYLYILSVLGEKIEDLEDALLSHPDQKTFNEINDCKRELNFLRKNIHPAKEMIFSLAKLESEFIKESTYVHLKELEDNISQAIDASDNYREILSDQLNIYHTTISGKLNDIMKFLTVFSVIFIPLTFIAGIYGTNFEYIPELSYKYSYFIMWVVMIIVAIGMLLFFKKKKWF